jgi:hypothetical protein
LKNNPLFYEIEEVEIDELFYNKKASHNIDKMTRVTNEKLK